MSQKYTPDRKLSAKQEKTLEALLNGESREGAALAGGIHRRTLYKWLNEDELFQTELNQRQTRAISHASIRLTGGIDVCASYLLEVVRDEEAPPSVRVRAALGWLDRQIKFVEVNEILPRLEALEQVIDA